MSLKPQFDKKKKNKYISKWCLYKKCYESDYTKIFVIDIADGMIKYKYTNGHEVIEDIEEFENTVFFPSPFKDDQSFDQPLIDSTKITC